MRPTPMPTVGEVLHHDWSRKWFSHLPGDPSNVEHLGRDYLVNGTSLDALTAAQGGLRASILVARDPAARGKRRRIRIWQGADPIKEESFYGLFGHRFQRIASAAFGLILQRSSHFFILEPESNPTYLFPLAQFSRFGVSARVLEEVLEAPVRVASEGLFARNAFVPSLRVFTSYDGNRYGDSTRKLFYDGHGNPVPVELVAREVLARLGYAVVPPGLLRRLFYALVGHPAAHFRPDAWPEAFLDGRPSPLEVVARAAERIDALRDSGIGPGLTRALEGFATRPPDRDFVGSEGALPLIAGTLTRRRFAAFLEAVGERRLLEIFQGFVRGHHVVSADWFAYMEGSHRVFPCEVKARGDHLRPYQKESILYCQATGLLDYRLLEVLHNRPHETLNVAST